MTRVRFDVSEDSLRALAATPDAFAQAVRLAAAMFWYGRSEITFGTAAALAGMSQAEFMHALKEAGQDTAVVDLDDLDRELTYIRRRRSPGSDGG